MKNSMKKLLSPASLFRLLSRRAPAISAPRVIAVFSGNRKIFRDFVWLQKSREENKGNIYICVTRPEDVRGRDFDDYEIAFGGRDVPNYYECIQYIRQRVKERANRELGA